MSTDWVVPQPAIDRLCGELARAKTAARLVAPYISGAIVDRILAARPAKLPLTLLTALRSDAVASGALSIDAVATLIEAGVEVRSVRNLHAKVYFVDDAVFVGSANLTNAGLTGANVEILVRLDAAQCTDVRLRVAEWFERAAVVGANDLARFAALPKEAPPADETGLAIGPRLLLALPPSEGARGASPDTFEFRVLANSLRQGSLRLGPGAASFFPSDAAGGSNRSSAGKALWIEREGFLNESPVETDIDGQKWIFRRRGRPWLAFFEHHALQPGDLIAVTRTGERTYRLAPRW